MVILVVGIGSGSITKAPEKLAQIIKLGDFFSSGTKVPQKKAASQR